MKNPGQATGPSSGLAGRLRAPIRRFAPAGVSISVGVAAGLVGPTFGVVIAGLLALSTFLWNPAVGLGLLLASRSSLDCFNQLALLPPPLNLNPAAFLGVVFILMAGLTVALLERSREGANLGGRLAAAWAGWLLMAFLAVVVGTMESGGQGFALGSRELVRLAALLSIHLLVVNLASHGRSSRVIVWSLVLGGIIPILYGFAQLLEGGAGGHNVYGIQRLASTFVHPNSFGRYSALLSLVCLGLFLDSKGRKYDRVFLVVIGLSSLFMMVLTWSRTAIGILGFAVLIWATLGSLRRRIAILVGFGTTAAIAAPFVAWRFADLLADPLTTEVDGNSWLWRLMNYRRLWDSFMESPIWGHGLRSVQWVNPTQSRTVDGYEVGFASHNELIRILVEQGLLGLAAWVFFAVVLLREVRRLARNQRPANEGGYPELGAALFCFATSAIVLSAVGTEVLSHTATLFLLVAGCAVLVHGQRSPDEAGHGGISEG